MSINRRNFIGYSVAGLGSLAFSAKSYSRIVGSNERINIGFMGTQSRGAGLLGSFAREWQGVNLTHNCDVDSRVLKRTHNAIIQAGFDAPKSDKDIRKILEDPFIRCTGNCCARSLACYCWCDGVRSRQACLC